MMTDTPILLWFRRDLRLDDHPMLAEAAATGRPLIPVFLHDEVLAGTGAAPAWRSGLAAEHFAATLASRGGRLIFRRGRALDLLEGLVAETGATAVWWSRSYDPVSKERDAAVKAALRGRGIDARSFPGHLLFEPWDVATGEGGFYRVYSPFWRAVRGRPVGPPLPPPKRLRWPDSWPVSDDPAAWRLAARMNRGAAVVREYLHIGEEAARARLDRFMDGAVGPYRDLRDYPGQPGTSGLSENLTYGEISPRLVWHRAEAAMSEGQGGAEHFLKELVWREFAWHLMHHTPHIGEAHWREAFNAFPWQGDSAEAERWRRGMTGEPLVDAALREMYVTGRMHNRARMIAASYLTKHLLTDWRIGQAWFEDCLVDWDPASNAMGWQWVAGSGPDAAPYFRIFNPAGQAEKFDADGAYRRAWIAEGQRDPPRTALAYFAAAPRSWGLSPGQHYPAPVIDLAAGRARALQAYSSVSGGNS